MTGWIGGGCVQGIVLKESIDAIQTGKSRLVKIGKNLTSFLKFVFKGRPIVKNISGGVLDTYI